jgi:hypothetical protein
MPDTPRYERVRWKDELKHRLKRLEEKIERYGGEEKGSKPLLVAKKFGTVKVERNGATLEGGLLYRILYLYLLVKNLFCFVQQIDI